MTNQKHVEKLNTGHTIEFHDRGFGWRVKAPLPENYGYTVGSEIGTPFSGYATDGTISKLMALQFGVSSRIGLVTQKIYQGPEPTEVTFDLNFNAYYSARHEVVAPVIKLMMMSVGQEKNLEETSREVAENIRSYTTLGEEQLGNFLDASGDVESTLESQSSSAAQLIRFMRTPSTVTVRVGNIFTLVNAYLSNVQPQFTNVLDFEYMPMSATCSVTLELANPMTKLRLSRAFGDAFRGSTEQGEPDVNPGI